MSKKTYTVKITAAVAFGGEIKRPGDILELPEDQAKNLFERGRAELHTADDPANSDGSDADPSLGDMSDDDLRAEAVDYDIAGADTMTRDELIAAIERAEADSGE